MEKSEQPLLVIVPFNPTPSITYMDDATAHIV